MAIKCIIVDDEPLARELLKSYVEKTSFMELVGCYTSAAEAVKVVISGIADVIFLDIQMPCLNGIEFAEIIPPTTRIIYVTAYEQYALQAFHANALDYLLKPVSYADFLRAVGKAAKWKAMNRAMLYAENAEKKALIVKSDYKLRQINFDNINYIEGQKDYVKFYLDCEPFVINSLLNMKDLAGSLPSSRFLRIHRSYIVNIDKITTIDRNRLVFGNQYLPISESFKDEYNEFLNSHLVKGGSSASLKGGKVEIEG